MENDRSIRIEITSSDSHRPSKAKSFSEHMQEREKEAQRKTVEEKAAEKGYYKGEDGEWWEAYSDGFDEKVEWFKLDEEYPDLADRAEALAEEYHVSFGDHSGLKRAVYKNAAALEKASDEHLANIFDVANAVSFSISGTEEKLVQYSTEVLEDIKKSLAEYYAMVAAKMPDGKLDARMWRISEHFVRNYTERMMNCGFLGKLADYSVEAFTNKENGRMMVRGIESGVEGIGRNGSDGRFFGDYMAYFSELVKDKRHITDYDTRAGRFRAYVLGHGIDERTVSGFRDVIYPLIEQGDNEIVPIVKGGNAYGVTLGAYGIADYTEECLLSLYNPKEIDKLVRIYHELPTSDYKKFEQNRKDAGRLQGTIIGGRDFIHDELPGVNEVLVAMKEYYEHRDSEDVDVFQDKLRELEDKYHFGILPNAFNLSMYDMSIEYMSDYNEAEEGSPDERAIDILNRLVQNTRPDLLKAPRTRYPELNELMGKINPMMNERTGEIRVGMKEVSEAVKAMNGLIRQNYGRQGIFPSTVSAIVFLDKMSVYALRSLSGKDLEELAFDDGFKEIVRFSQLTSSMGYSESDFESRYRRVVERISEAYGKDGVDRGIISDGYRFLGQDILRNMQALGKHYAMNKVTARFQDAIWSGNLNDELIGLFQRV